MSPRNELQDSFEEISVKLAHAHNSNYVREGKSSDKSSSNSVKFELGPSKDSYNTKSQVRFPRCKKCGRLRRSFK